MAAHRPLFYTSAVTKYCVVRTNIFRVAGGNIEHKKAKTGSP